MCESSRDILSPSIAVNDSIGPIRTAIGYSADSVTRTLCNQVNGNIIGTLISKFEEKQSSLSQSQ